MTRAVLAAQSGWGKSWMTQWWTEDNIGSVDVVVVLDYKDEYRGLAKAGFSAWAGVGNREASLSTEGWRQFLEENGSVVLARAVDNETWQEVAGRVAKAARSLDAVVLIVVDEAHFLVPQRGSYPDALKGVATTGRGESVSSMWVSQRLTEMDETVLAQANTRVLGGFTSDADIGKVSRIVDYQAEVHNPQLSNVGVTTEIDRENQPVQKFVDDGSTVGSEWIYSTSSGERRRIDTRQLTMQSTHFGAEGHTLSTPG